MLPTAFILWSFAALVHSHQEPSNSPSITLAKKTDTESEQFSFAPQRRFLLYDVNPGEGFNLRRDVYMRMANVVRQLRDKGNDFILVLPPWGRIWHWKRRDVSIPWGELFDLDSLATFVPVIEFGDFLEKHEDTVDRVLYLQHYAEGWSEEEGGFVMKYDIRPCMEAQKYYRKVDSKWAGPFFGHQMFAREFDCLSIQGHSSTLVDAILQLHPTGSSLMIDRAETILHDHFGDAIYWRARKSMRYARPLMAIGDEFRRRKFDSHGDNFMCAHLRRADFVWSRRENVPTIEGAAKQLVKISNSNSLGLKNLFLCTDGSPEEVEKLEKILDGDGIRVERFTGDNGKELSEAAISIIDQWICAHARWFIGTHQSTFSFRIHEDREIIGHQPNTTFNSFCADGQEECEQPAKWTIVRE